MVIAVVGLGLIGGSLCKAVKAYTGHTCLGLDIDAAATAAALARGAIDEAVAPEALDRADITIVCLYPDAALSFLRAHAGRFRRGSLVMDVCGVKRPIVDEAAGLLAERGVIFLGAHPMAGREFSGFAYADKDLFRGASCILTPRPDTPAEALAAAETLMTAVGCGTLVHCTPAQHDRAIAFTSQLAHIVSNAYIKSPTLRDEPGFSAGSFQDLTRVARLNEDMWTPLFLYNRDNLIAELDTLMDHLARYRAALAAGDGDTLRDLLREGRQLKENGAHLDRDDPG